MWRCTRCCAPLCCAGVVGGELRLASTGFAAERARHLALLLFARVSRGSSFLFCALFFEFERFSSCVCVNFWTALRGSRRRILSRCVRLPECPVSGTALRTALYTNARNKLCVCVGARNPDEVHSARPEHAACGGGVLLAPRCDPLGRTQRLTQTASSLSSQCSESANCACLVRSIAVQLCCSAPLPSVTTTTTTRRNRMDGGSSSA